MIIPWNVHIVTILGVYFPFYFDISRVLAYYTLFFVAIEMNMIACNFNDMPVALPFVTLHRSIHWQSNGCKRRTCRVVVVSIVVVVVVQNTLRTHHDNAIVILNYSLAYFITHFCSIITVMNSSMAQKLTRLIKLIQRTKWIDDVRLEGNAILLFICDRNYESFGNFS